LAETQPAPRHRLPADRGIGAAIAGVAMRSLSGASGATAYVVNSMLTISALYLTAGLIERATGQADIRRMGGLYARNTPLAMIFLLLVVTVAGVPPFLGFCEAATGPGRRRTPRRWCNKRTGGRYRSPSVCSSTRS